MSPNLSLVTLIITWVISLLFIVRFFWFVALYV